MRQSVISAILLAFTSLSQATFTFPTEGTSWPAGKENTIKWDTSGIQEPISLYLGSVGAIDISGAKQIASGVPNTGYLSWTPDSSCESESASLYGVDAKGKMIHSQKFNIIVINNGGGSYHGTAGQLTTYTTVSTATSYATLTSILATETVHTESYVQTLYTPPAVFYNTTISTSTQDAIVTTTPLVGTAPAANGTFVSPTATTGAPQTSFTGAGALFSIPKSNSLFAVGLVGLFFMGLM